mmetsp:Transcript_23315/g.59511  ORF Transcript_23315/g.59511 Transcript_23315/m.59511 type:complete len:203 (+) Transcript_23315:613-1221(+)
MSGSRRTNQVTRSVHGGAVREPAYSKYVPPATSGDRMSTAAATEIFSFSSFTGIGPASRTSNATLEPIISDGGGSLASCAERVRRPRWRKDSLRALSPFAIRRSLSWPSCINVTICNGGVHVLFGNRAYDKNWPSLGMRAMQPWALRSKSWHALSAAKVKNWQAWFRLHSAAHTPIAMSMLGEVKLDMPMRPPEHLPSPRSE